jgi:nitrate reductase gamma subunit
VTPDFIYYFLVGPFAWLTFGVFLAGCLYRLSYTFILAARKERFIFTHWSLKYGMRSILHWVIPFAAVNMRKHPLMTIVTFLFHVCLIVVPVFILPHLLLLEEAWNIRWWSLPELLGDAMTLIIIGCCLGFLVRRFVSPEVRFLSSFSDFLITAMVSAPFITGFMAYHQWLHYPWMLNLHIFSGELLLIFIPFTRLSHMVLFPFTRAYVGSEFGGVRHAKDW